MIQDERAKRERARETQALLQILAIGEDQVSAGKVHSLADVVKIIRTRRPKLEVAATASRNKPRKARELD